MTKEIFSPIRKCVSISPFVPEVSSGVTWRINFVNSMLLQQKLLILWCFRWDTQKYSEHTDDITYRGTSSKILHLFDIRVFQLILSLRWEWMYLYCHTIWSWIYWLVGKIFFGIPFFLDDHNVEFDRYKSYNKWWWCYLIFCYELILVLFADTVILSSQQDRDRMAQLYRVKHKFQIIENSFSSENHVSMSKNGSANFFDNKQSLRTKNMLLFFASFLYFPNIESLLFIKKEIAPYLSEEYEIIIAGVWSEKFDEGEKNIQYLGFVEDLDSLIRQASLVIVPVFSGWGVKIKILHAMSLGAKILTTQEWVRGIDYSWNSRVRIASRESFLSQIMTIL